MGDIALAPLKKLYIGFGDLTVLEMIDHLRLKTAIKMTTAQKHEYKIMGYNNPWDPTTSITAYFTQLDRFQVSLGNHGIATSKAEKTMAAGAQMWQSKMFTEDQMVPWENKPAAQQTWAALQVYFTKKWLERNQYSTTNGKTIAIQRGSAFCPRNSSSQGRRRIAGHVVCNATQRIRQPDRGDDSNAQSQHGCIDEEDECNIGGWRRKAKGTK